MIGIQHEIWENRGKKPQAYKTMQRKDCLQPVPHLIIQYVIHGDDHRKHGTHRKKYKTYCIYLPMVVN